MAETLATLRTELASRGFDYLSSTRLNRYINLGYVTDLCEEDDWPFLRATTTGTAPITITDLRTIESVINSTQKYKLKPLDRRIITDLDTDLTTAGTPAWYYKTSGTAVAVYPANTTDTLSVNYYKFPAELTGDSDEPVVPQRWRYLVVEAAARRAYMDDDKADLSAMCEQEYQRGVSRMRQSLIDDQHDRPGLISVVTGSDDAYTVQSLD